MDYDAHSARLRPISIYGAVEWMPGSNKREYFRVSMLIMRSMRSRKAMRSCLSCGFECDWMRLLLCANVPAGAFLPGSPAVTTFQQLCVSTEERHWNWPKSFTGSLKAKCIFKPARGFRILSMPPIVSIKPDSLFTILHHHMFPYFFCRCLLLSFFFIILAFGLLLFFCQEW